MLELIFLNWALKKTHDISTEAFDGLKRIPNDLFNEIRAGVSEAVDSSIQEFLKKLEKRTYLYLACIGISIVYALTAAMYELPKVVAATIAATYIAIFALLILSTAKKAIYYLNLLSNLDQYLKEEIGREVKKKGDVSQTIVNSIDSNLEILSSLCLGASILSFIGKVKQLWVIIFLRGFIYLALGWLFQAYLTLLFSEIAS